jgi:hypothetical protein
MDEVVKRQQHDGGKVKVLRRQESMREVLGQIMGVGIRLSEAEEAVEPRAALGLVERKDWTSWVESYVTGLRTAMVDGNAKVEDVQ